MMLFSTLSLLILSWGLFVALQPSYIHPDEHFQTLEILAQRFYGIVGTIAWEFDSANPARSLVPLYMFYGPVMVMLRLFDVQNPFVILQVIRLQNILAYAIVLYWYLRGLKSNRHKTTIFRQFIFNLSSYVACTYQAHSFSNSLETLILLAVLQIMNNPNLVTYDSIVMGLLFSVGVFNRMTFPAFVMLPCIKLLIDFYFKHPKDLACLICSFLVVSTLIVLIDTVLFGAKSIVIAPLNNLLYNLDQRNLSLHGLHAYYTHALVNLPQLVGPAILSLANKEFYKSSRNSYGSLSIISALVLLSCFKHQEARFLVPVIPLICINFYQYSKSSVLKSSRLARKICFTGWIIFNFIMALIIGVFHQRGVLDSISYLQPWKHDCGLQIWWKTYSPPSWLYMSKELRVSTTNIVGATERLDDIDFEVQNDHVVDLKGCDSELFENTIKLFFGSGAVNLTVIVPSSKSGVINSMTRLGYKVSLQKSINWHLDLDHLDWDDFRTFKPSINIYTLSVQGHVL